MQRVQGPLAGWNRVRPQCADEVIGKALDNLGAEDHSRCTIRRTTLIT